MAVQLLFRGVFLLWFFNITRCRAAVMSILLYGCTTWTQAKRIEKKPDGNCSHIHHHHHVTLVARISLTLSRHSFLSFITLGRSSGQHPVSSHSCWMYVRAGRPAFARPCVGVHKSTSLMSSSLLLQQCPACLTYICLCLGDKFSRRL